MQKCGVFGCFLANAVSWILLLGSAHWQIFTKKTHTQNSLPTHRTVNIYWPLFSAQKSGLHFCDGARLPECVRCLDKTEQKDIRRPRVASFAGTSHVRMREHTPAPRPCTCANRRACAHTAAVAGALAAALPGSGDLGAVWLRC